ncbi:unnamed protein product [Phytophthora fragariaefolia]|uniref:Adenine DNA glycosylase n=1 Tax=Phytophthora fragariaefolia TaxID=1490495 RepID=A0A9W6UF65_9STRA|nr:unnamed protein product [Phytophthora fragariaefolia]
MTYLTGAIASIAFGNREPLVDGNVIRVMARMRAVGADPKNKQLINFSWKAAKELVGECDRPGALNQALMELGATMCTVQVTKYPLKAKKNDSRKEVIAVAVVTSPGDDVPTEEPTRGKRKASKSVVEPDASPSNWKFLMSKRPAGGLLAGQWEFLHSKVRYPSRTNSEVITISHACAVQMSDGDKIPPFSKRKTFMDARLTDLFGQEALARSGQSICERRDVGELTHIFSHVKHHMGVEHLHFKSQPEFLAAVESDELRWMTVAEMRRLGITTGVKKILQLVLHPEKKSSKAKSVKSVKSVKSTKSSATSAVSRGGGLSPAAVRRRLPPRQGRQPQRQAFLREERLPERALPARCGAARPGGGNARVAADPFVACAADYYMIDGVRHDAFLYIRYVNGAAPQSGWFDLITRYARLWSGERRRSLTLRVAWWPALRPLFALFSIASLGWKKLIEGFGVEDFDDDTSTVKLARPPPSAPVDSANIVPDAMKSPRPGSSYSQITRAKYADDTDATSRIAKPASQGRNELDDLLDMLGDEDSKPAAVHPRPMSSSRAGAYNSPEVKSTRTEFQAGGTKRSAHGIDRQREPV